MPTQHNHLISLIITLLAIGSAGCDGELFFRLIAEVLSPTPTDEICGDTLDNDSDGLVDCEDPDCAMGDTCTPHALACNTEMPDNDPPTNDALPCTTWTYTADTNQTRRTTRTFDEHGRPLTISLDQNNNNTPEQTITSQWNIDGDLKRRIIHRDDQGQETRTILWRYAPNGEHFLIEDSQQDTLREPYLFYDDNSKTYYTTNCLECTGEFLDPPEEQDHFRTAFDAQDRVTSHTHQTLTGNLQVNQYHPDQTLKQHKRFELRDLLGLHEEFAVTEERYDRRGRIIYDYYDAHYELPTYIDKFAYKDTLLIKKLIESKDYWALAYYGTLLSASLDQYGNPDTLVCQNYHETGWGSSSIEYIEDLLVPENLETCTFEEDEYNVYEDVGSDRFIYTWEDCSIASVTLGRNQIRYTYNTEDQRIRSTYLHNDNVTKIITHHPDGWIQSIDEDDHLLTFDDQGHLITNARYNNNRVLLTETRHDYQCWD